MGLQALYFIVLVSISFTGEGTAVSAQQQRQLQRGTTCEGSNECPGPMINCKYLTNFDLLDTVTGCASATENVTRLRPATGLGVTAPRRTGSASLASAAARATGAVSAPDAICADGGIEPCSKAPMSSVSVMGNVRT